MCSSESSGRNGISHQLCQCFYREWIRYFRSRRTLNTCFGVTSHCHPLRPLSQCGQSMQKNWIFTVIRFAIIYSRMPEICTWGFWAYYCNKFPQCYWAYSSCLLFQTKTQFKITSSAPLFLLHLSCKTHSRHIIGRQETWGAFQDWVEDVFDAVSLTCFSLSLISETSYHPVMVIGTQGWRAGAHVPINCLALDDFSLTPIQAAICNVVFST